VGWKPKTSFGDLVSETMLQYLKLAERDELVNRHSFRFSIITNRH
jgi:GDPmannose 4,6-dehydratase